MIYRGAMIYKRDLFSQTSHVLTLAAAAMATRAHDMSLAQVEEELRAAEVYLYQLNAPASASATDSAGRIGDHPQSSIRHASRSERFDGSRLHDDAGGDYTVIDPHRRAAADSTFSWMIVAHACA